MENIPDTKECHYCHEHKTFDKFDKSNHCKFGITNKCKECRRKYHLANIDHNRKVAIQWRNNHLERSRKNSIDYYYNNKEHLREKAKEWNKNNPNFHKEYRHKNKEKCKIWTKKWRDKNKEYYREYARKYNKNVRKFNINDRIAHRIRRRIRNEIKQARGIKLVSTSGLVGCSWDDLMKHIENQFYDKILSDGTTLKMSWKNYGYGEKCWHLDHFLPCCSFDLSKIENQRKCFHFSNLRPLWQSENCAKSHQDRKLSIKNQLNIPSVV